MRFKFLGFAASALLAAAVPCAAKQTIGDASVGGVVTEVPAPRIAERARAVAGS